MKTLHLPIFTILMAFLVVAVSFLPQDAHAMSITVHTDKPSYSYGDTYTISGKVNPVIQNQIVSIVILSPNYPHPESFSVVPSSDGRYSHTLPLPIKDVPAGNFTIIAQYDVAKNQTSFNYAGLPCSQENIQTYGSAPPIIRMPASNPRILDSSGNAITGPVRAGQQIQITYPLANGLNCNMPFAYIVQIQDHNGITVSLSWINGTLPAGQSLNPSQSWTPRYTDTYTAQIFTWQSLDNPNALMSPASFSFDVVPNADFTQSSQIVSEIPSKFTDEFPTMVKNSPLKQMGSGTSTQNIVCSSGLELVYKSTNDYPACVTPQTDKNLIKRGWGILQPVNYLVNISGVLVHYNITGGTIQGAKLDTQYQSLTFSFNMTNNGMLNVTLPRALVDAKCTDRCILPHGTDIPFAILNDHGQQVYFTEIGTTPINRILSIQIPRGLEQIEITHIQPV